MQLSAAQRGYLWVGQATVPALINLVLNGMIGWAMFRSVSELPRFGNPSIVGDTLGTCFFLPAITCLIVTPLVRGQVKKGAVPAFTGALAGWLRPFQRGLGLRACALGLVCIPFAGGLAIVLLAALGVEALGFAHFLGLKALYAGVLAALVTPVIALLALADR